MLSKATIRQIQANLKDAQGLEKRFWNVPEGELRAEGEGDAKKLVGHAALFDTFSVDLGPFKEIIRKGAFKESLKNDDIRMLWNHDTNLVMARTKNGSLKVSEDKKGLKFEAEPDTSISWVSDHMKTVERGDVDQMSFRFETIKDRWGSEEGETIRELLKVRVAEISPVTFPAYEATSVQTRSIFMENGIEIDCLANALGRIQAGESVDPSEMEIVKRSLEILNGYFSDDAFRGRNAGDIRRTDGLSDEDEWRESLSVKLKRLELGEKYLS